MLVIMARRVNVELAQPPSCKQPWQACSFLRPYAPAVVWDLPLPFHPSLLTDVCCMALRWSSTFLNMLMPWLHLT